MNQENSDVYALFKACLTADIDSNLGGSVLSDIAGLRLLSRCDKRFPADSRRFKSLEEQGFEKFIATNQLCSLRSCLIGLTPDEISLARNYIVESLESVSSCLQEDFDLGIFLSMCRPGPGAIVGSRSTHAVDKFNDTSWTVTDAARPLLNAYFLSSPLLKQIRSGIELVSVPGSRMTSVPKDKDSNRLVCTEPAGNMLLQLGAGEYVASALRFRGLDIQNQQNLFIQDGHSSWINTSSNQYLAWLGSLDQSFSTLDLSSASDLISVELIRLLWPPTWFGLLTSIRSPVTCVNGRIISLSCISTMGNGFTFPVMTMTLMALCYAVNCKRFKVFGDDIIVERKSTSAVVGILDRAGLSVNTSKSFWDTCFRESCGGDYFYGYDVTPVYIKSLDNLPSVYVAINQILEWSAKHEIMLTLTLRFLVDLGSKLNNGCKLHIVPEWEQSYSGIRAVTASRKRYSRMVIVPRKRRAPITYGTILCILGGYVSCTKSGDPWLYSPRAYSVVYKNQKCVLMPHGNKTGRAPEVRCSRSSEWISAALSLIE